MEKKWIYTPSTEKFMKWGELNDTNNRAYPRDGK